MRQPSDHGDRAMKVNAKHGVVVWKVKRPPHNQVGQRNPPISTSSDARSTLLTAANGPKASPPPTRKAFHPFADIFPMLGEDRLQELARDINSRGLLDHIMLHEGQILDGRCRYVACEIAGVEPQFQDYVGDDPLSFVVSRNLHRRHLTESQRAVVAARLADLKPGANQHTPGLPIGRAADLLNVGTRTVARAREVLRRGVPELVKAVERGEVTVSAATDICAKPEAEQREIVTTAPDTGTNGKNQKARRKGRRLKQKQHDTDRDDMVPAAEVEHLKAELAVANERQRQLTQELENERVMASRAPAVDASMKAPSDLDIPPILDRRPLSPADKLAFDAVMAAWADATALRAALVGASPVARERFIAVLRADIASSSSAAK
jgi:hypothetical protein